MCNKSELTNGGSVPKKPKMDLDERIAVPVPAEELVKAVLEVDPDSEPVDRPKTNWQPPEDAESD